MSIEALASHVLDEVALDGDHGRFSLCTLIHDSIAHLVRDGRRLGPL